MLMTDIIAKKRDGVELSAAEIEFFVRGVTDGSIPDYQTAALLMAIVWRGMNRRETAGPHAGHDAQRGHAGTSAASPA